LQASCRNTSLRLKKIWRSCKKTSPIRKSPKSPFSYPTRPIF
tara:strand:+ start:105607 stop:105732 length:126 start_codon:yes stop_codon:yes gene_type:complete